ncbi:hypothetical protein PVAG01_06505 [Phlyctema vagabunda]|uniref:WD40 repeat protein n=1 Tax=Phlyctema vagabunda TaxID=108571 RepID=A0ABR4PGC5_9HELO
MPTSAPASLFLHLADIWRALSLRSDVDNIILELLGQFSLERVYADSDEEAYQQLVMVLFAQLNAIFYIQRLSLPSESLQSGPYLGILASWEVTLRVVDFVLQVVVEGRECLWNSQLLRDKYLAELLLSALRFLALHPKAPANHRLKDRRERFARIHRSLERVYDGYPGPKSFLLVVCKEVTDALRTDPDTLSLPQRLRYELPNLTSEMYPLADCLSSSYVATIVPQDSSSYDWLAQFLALRDVSHFVVGASIQYHVNGESRDFRVQACSARTRNAVLHALENLSLPPHLSKIDLITVFSDTFRVILPDTLSLTRRGSESNIDEYDMDAIDALRLKLDSRRILHRISDGEVMRNITEITRTIALLDDPSGQFRAAHPKLYVLDCKRLHLTGGTQMRLTASRDLPPHFSEGSDTRLPPHSKCSYCGESVTRMREVPIVRQTWDLLKPLELNADTLNAERHLTTQYQLSPPKCETGMSFASLYNTVGVAPTQRVQEPLPSPPVDFHGVFAPSISLEKARPITQPEPPPVSPTSQQVWQPSESPHVEIPTSEYLLSTNETLQGEVSRIQSTGKISDGARDSHLSRSSTTEISSLPVVEPLISSPKPVPIGKDRSVTVIVPVEKGKSKWMSKLKASRKNSIGASGDTSSISSTTLEPQRLEEVSLKNLTSASKVSVRGKSAKNINVYLSQNSEHALFWTQLSIQIWDVGNSPPTMKRSIATESTCLMAVVTKNYLAYIIGTRDQRLTLRIMNLAQPSVTPIDYRMDSSLWCKSIALCPKENYVVVGFENATVRFFKTTKSEPPREDRLHVRQHSRCKECPPVETLSFSNDGLALIASTRSPKTGKIQIYLWRFPFVVFQDLPSCSYYVPLHESEDNGVSSAIFRSGPGGEDDLLCVTTWTQSGVPILVQPENGHRSDIKTEVPSRQRLGNRIQSAAFSPSGRELAMVNDKGHLYHISNLNSSPMDVKRLATSKELTSKSDAFAMLYMTLPDEDAIILAWADPSKSIGYIKKIPVPTSNGEVSIPATPGMATISPQAVQHELSGESREPPKPPVELNVAKDNTRMRNVPVEPYWQPTPHQEPHLSRSGLKEQSRDEQKCLVQR